MTIYNLKEAEKQRIQLGAFLRKGMGEEMGASQTQVAAWFAAVSKLLVGYGLAHQVLDEMRTKTITKSQVRGAAQTALGNVVDPLNDYDLAKKVEDLVRCLHQD